MLKDELFSREHIIPSSYLNNYTNQILIIKPQWFNENSLSQENQLFLATGGFGCDPERMGTAVYGTFIADGEKARLERFDFIGIIAEEFIPEWAKEKLRRLTNMEKIFKIKYEGTITIKPEHIDLIMADALEGGINYWCRKAEVVGEYKGEYASDQISRGGTLILYDKETSDKWELTLEKFLKGMKLWAQNTNDLTITNIEDIDGEDIDEIIQYAIFDEIVFG